MVLATPESLPNTVDAAAVLKDLYANRDDRSHTRLVADKPFYNAKQDRVTFSRQVPINCSRW
jgi:hypothetical protein